MQDRILGDRIAELEQENMRLRAELQKVKDESYCPICGHYHYPRCNRGKE